MGSVQLRVVPSHDIDSELQQMNPLLLNFMNSITLTIHERKYPTLEKQTPKESTNMEHFGTTTILHKSQSTTIVSRSYCRRQFWHAANSVIISGATVQVVQPNSKLKIL